MRGFGAAFGQRAARLDLFEALACAGDLLEDTFHAGGPREGRGIGVPRFEECSDGALQIAHAVEGAAAHGLLAEFGEPAFDQMEPARTGGNEVQHKARMPLEPALDALVTVGAIVVEDQVQRRFAGKLGVESLEKF